MKAGEICSGIFQSQHAREYNFVHFVKILVLFVVKRIL